MREHIIFKFSVVFFVITLPIVGYFTWQTFGSTIIGRTLNSNPDLQRGLVGHWTFDGKDMVGGTVFDTSSQGNNGVMVSMATSTAYVPGKIGQGLNFDGVDDYVDLGTSNRLTGDKTISAWIKSPDCTNPNNDVVIGVSSWNNAGYIFWINSGNVDWGDAQSSELSWVGGESKVCDNNWHLVTAVRRGSVGEIWADGTLQTSGGVFTDSTSSKATRIASYYGAGASGFFAGTQDDVRIYNRALSVAEIKRLYDLGATTKINVTLDSNPDLKNGLVGHWTFDGKNLINNAEDTSGQGNTGYLEGFTSTTTAPGKMGQGLNFDGVDDYVVANSVTNNLGPLPVTVSAWVYPNDISRGVPYSFHSGGANRNIFFWAQGGVTGKFSHYDTTNSFIYSADTFAPNEWYHVVSRIDSGANGVMFVNGKQQATWSNSDTGTINQFSIGQEWDNSTPTDFFNGKIDDVRIYNRVLSASEIKRLYHLGATTKTNVTLNTNSELKNSLVGHWTFDGKDMVGGTVFDTSSQGNNGVMVSMATSTAYVPGKMGQGLNFDGVDDYIDAGDVVGADNSSTFSVAFWGFQRPIAATAGWVQKGVSMGTGDWLVQNAYGNNNIRFYIENGGSVYRLTSDSAYADNTWFYATVVYDGGLAASDKMKIYIDGVRRDNSTVGTLPSTIGDSATAVELGRGYGGVQYNSAIIDDVRIYDRALSVAEIKRLYDLGR